MTTVVAAVIERDGRVLIAQRKRTGHHHPLKWEFPGGKVEPGEIPENGLVRELEEELGIRALVGPEIGRYEFQYQGRWPIMLMFYRVTEFSGEPKNLAFEQILWAPRERLGDYDFLEGDAEFLSQYTHSEPRP
jgi:8-oxo-dGTP diphosphatase